MNKSHSIEQLRTIIRTMRDEEKFSRYKNELILQQSRVSRIEKEVENQTITEEIKNVELRKLFVALESLAQVVGLENALVFFSVDDDTNSEEITQ